MSVERTRPPPATLRGGRVRVAFDIHETEIDGVPTLWMDGQGPMTAVLSFRVGVADELVPQRGITHLIEHLALGPLGMPDYEHNGTVEGIRTLFVAAGSPEEVVTFLDEVTRSLSDLQTERILHERAILRREAAEQPTSIGSFLRGYRFGSIGHGAVAEDEHGAGWLGPEPVRRWVGERFVRDNAALIINRAPPPGLRLHLNSGRRWPVPAATSPDWLPLPSHLAWPHSGAALTYTFARGGASNIAANVLHRRARNALRFEDGSVYDIAFEWDSLDRTHVHALYGTETDEGKVAGVTARLLGVHDRLAAEGPTAAEIASEVATVHRHFEHPDGRFAFVDVEALDLLLGVPRRSPAEFLDMRAAIRPEDVRTALVDAGSRILLATSADNPAPDRLQPYPQSSPGNIAGDLVSPAGFRLPGVGPRERLVVGGDGVAIRIAGADVVAVRYDDLAMVQHTTESRTLVGTDGSRIQVEAKLWRGGKQIIAAIDARVPLELVACDEHSPGALAEPEGRS